MTEEWLSSGDLTYARGDRAVVRGAQEYPDVLFAAPYGVYALPPQGERVVLLYDGEETMGIGVPMRGERAQPGEILLRSAGGAYLLLKKDGTAELNGQSFPAVPKGEA